MARKQKPGFTAPNVLRCVCDPRKTLRRIELDEAQRFQRDLKVLPEIAAEKLDKSMEAKGFLAPLFLWYEHDAILDGTQRRDRLVERGWTVDGGIPVVEIEAEDEKDAAEKLLLIASQYGQVQQDGLIDFADTFSVDLADFTLPEFAEIDMDVFDKKTDKPDSIGGVCDCKEGSLPEDEEKEEFWEWLHEMERIYVMFSGGKDSMAQVACLLDHGVPVDQMYLVHCRTPLDYPGLEEFVREYAGRVGIYVDVIGPPNDFESAALNLRRTGFPKSFLTRWCTIQWKVFPLRQYVKDNGIRDARNKVLCEGFRAEEGGGRELVARRIIQGTHRARMARPILDWTTKDVFAAIEKHGWDLHPIYKWSRRLSCIFCFATKRDEWNMMREKDPELFHRALALVAEGCCSPNISGEDAKNVLRKMMGMGTIAGVENDG